MPSQLHAGFQFATRRPAIRRAGLVCLAATILAAAGFAGYQRLFSSFAPYDDEGYVMISLSSYLEGKPLYDETYSQYGPAYYALNGAFHRITALPITHDVVRLKTLAAWLLAAAMAAAFVYRCTGRTWLSLVALPTVFCHLDRLGLEPGHPQDVCLLGVIGVLLLTTSVDGRAVSGRAILAGSASDSQRRHSMWLPLVALGLLIAIVAMTKLNIGIFLLVSVSMAMLIGASRGRLTGILLALCVAAAVLLPVVLMHDFLLTWAGMRLPWIIVLALGAACYVAFGNSPQNAFSLRHLAAFWGACGVSCLAFGAITLIGGTSPQGLLDGLVLQHLGFGDGFFKKPPIFPLAVPAALLSVVAAVAVRRGSPAARRAVQLVVVVIAVGVGLRQAIDTFQPLTHGADDRGLAALLASFFVPLLWLLLIPTGDRQTRGGALTDRTRFARTTLCFVAALQPLAAYPIPGTQMAIGSVGLLLAVLICLSDSLGQRNMLAQSDRLFRRSVAVVMVVLALTTIGCRDIHLWRTRAALQPLALPGAERLRLPAAEVAQKRWVVDQLRGGGTFLAMPNGYHSYYFWAALPPPTALNTTIWPQLLDPREQRDVIRALSRFDRVCLVVDRALPPPDRDGAPLVRYLYRHFKPAAKNGNLEIWRMREHSPPDEA